MTVTAEATVAPVATVPPTTFEVIGWRLAAHRRSRDAERAFADISARVVPGARWASVSRSRGGRLRTVASSDGIARAVDDIQYSLGLGPAVDAADVESTCVCGDLTSDCRWPGLGGLANERYGVASVVATPVPVESGDDPRLVLTVYGDHVGAFTSSTADLVRMLASCAGVGIAAVLNRERADHLAEALTSNREIGVAMGVLMTTRLLTREQAFDELRRASQDGNRKLRDVASEVADTGVLVMPSTQRRRRPTACP